jgi:hypothetical protein
MPSIWQSCLTRHSSPVLIFIFWLYVAGTNSNMPNANMPNVKVPNPKMSTRHSAERTYIPTRHSAETSLYRCYKVQNVPQSRITTCRIDKLSNYLLRPRQIVKLLITTPTNCRTTYYDPTLLGCSF